MSWVIFNHNIRVIVSGTFVTRVRAVQSLEKRVRDGAVRENLVVLTENEARLAVMRGRL